MAARVTIAEDGVGGSASKPIYTTPTTTTASIGAVTIEAGSAVIGKVGIDQTTPGTTNGVQVNAALPAGTNNIGDVDVLSLPALPTGANVIGGVTIADGSDAAQGVTTGAAVVTDANGTLQQYLRGLVTLAIRATAPAATSALTKSSADLVTEAAAFGYLWNPVTSAWTKKLGNDSFSWLASAVRTATTTTSALTNYNQQSMLLLLRVTAFTTGTLTPSITVADPVGGTYITLKSFAAISGTGDYWFYIGNAAVTDTAFNGGFLSCAMPYSWKFVITHSDASNQTYTLGALPNGH
jgi:hypothetical protein